MVEALVPALSGLTALAAYAGIRHGVIALRRPLGLMHLLFAALCVAAAAQFVAKISVLGAESAQSLVESRRWEVSAVMVFFAVLPWFVAIYTGSRTRRLHAALGTFFVLALTANLVLVNGLSFDDLGRSSALQDALISDLRQRPVGPWHWAMGLALLVTLGLGVQACAQQYRRGARRQALVLGLCIGLATLAQMVNFGISDATHVSEIGIASLVLAMSHEVSDERAEAQHLRTILDQLPMMVHVKGLDGRYLFANRTCRKHLDAPGESAIGKMDFELVPPAQAEAARALDRRVLAGAQPCHSDETVIRGGTVRHYDVLRFPLLGPDGRPEATCCIATDVTDLVRAEREVELLRRSVWHADRVERTAALAASVAHEISQPLTAILSNAQAGLRFLARDTPDLQELREILKDIVRDDKRAGGVINGLRAMLRRQETPRERTDVGRCVREVIELMHSEFVEHGVEVGESLSTGCAGLLDKGQIQQVLLNLMMNADEAMAALPAGQRRLWISVSRTGEQAVRIAVRDSGPGIPGEAIEHVFDGFYSTKPQGLGMGLSLCRSIVEAHGGSIRVEANDGKGVTFAFTLPIEAAVGGRSRPAFGSH